MVFCCTFRAGELAVAMSDGRLRIEREGKHAKLVTQPQLVCFHGPSAIARGQQVLYVTERAVFELTARGLALREVAPGVDPMKDILPQMEFAPVIEDVRLMDAECFR